MEELFFRLFFLDFVCELNYSVGYVIIASSFQVVVVNFSSVVVVFKHYRFFAVQQRVFRAFSGICFNIALEYL